MPRTNSSSRARICLCKQNTNDAVETLGANIPMSEKHHDQIRDTLSHGMKQNPCVDYRNQIKHIYSFFQNEYPEYFEVGVVELTQEQKNDPDKFYHKNVYDLKYEGINVQLIKAFLGQKKVKANGKVCSMCQLQKYQAAIQ